jgi:7,8-dihydroneopterin aldolase/epimerase/oxygenase
VTIASNFYLLRISRIEAFASIGIHGFERVTNQKLLVSVVLLVKQRPAQTDEIADALDYDFIREGVLALVSSRHFNLQETLCGKILDLCLANESVLGAVVQTDKPEVYPGVASVACRMARLSAALPDFPWWTIEI